MKDAIVIDLLSHAYHLNQILTGFHRYSLLSSRRLIINDCVNDPKYKLKKTALVARIDGKVIIYDMADGYQSIEVIKYLLSISDYYFKRSFSSDENHKHGLKGILPLGMNYNITWLGNPLFYKRKLGKIRTYFEWISGTLVTPEKLEMDPCIKNKTPAILFFTRLWPEENYLSEQENQERVELNRMRINIIRCLKKNIGSNFMGGVEDSMLAQKMASDLVLPNKYSKRSKYIEIMKKADICISSLGLHKSIGWKMGEYVAASKAIISENLYYEVTGDFERDKNYFGFCSFDQCLEQVYKLYGDSDLIYNMQCRNHDYYKKYLKPERLIMNSLALIGIE